MRKRLQHAMQSAKLGGVWNHDSKFMILLNINILNRYPVGPGISTVGGATP